MTAPLLPVPPGETVAVCRHWYDDGSSVLLPYVPDRDNSGLLDLDHLAPDVCDWPRWRALAAPRVGPDGVLHPDFDRHWPRERDLALQAIRRAYPETATLSPDSSLASVRVPAPPALAELLRERRRVLADFDARIAAYQQALDAPVVVAMKDGVFVPKETPTSTPETPTP